MVCMGEQQELGKKKFQQRQQFDFFDKYFQF